jgi:hypothetical protein
MSIASVPSQGTMEVTTTNPETIVAQRQLLPTKEKRERKNHWRMKIRNLLLQNHPGPHPQNLPLLKNPHHQPQNLGDLGV